MKSVAIVIAVGFSLFKVAPVFADNVDCTIEIEPVVSLEIGSRYTKESTTRSDIDPVSNAAVNAALRPIDDFIRSLTRDANKVLRGGENQAALADCVVAQIAAWAKADAFSDLNTFTANLTIGGRLAGFALAYKQVAPFAQQTEAKDQIEEWLEIRVIEQMTFWEEEATAGAKKGNLRGWATMAINIVGEILNDPVMLSWSEWSATLLQCHALEDGSLPQEMRRGKYALHYQLHAVAPMVVTAMLLERQGRSIHGVCDNALDRIVAFTIKDLETGEASKAHSGEEQVLFGGASELKPILFFLQTRS